MTTLIFHIPLLTMMVIFHRIFVYMMVIEFDIPKSEIFLKDQILKAGQTI